MTDEDRIKLLREKVEQLTRANEIVTAQRDELRRIFAPTPQPVDAERFMVVPVEWDEERRAARLTPETPAT